MCVSMSLCVWVCVHKKLMKSFLLSIMMITVYNYYNNYYDYELVFNLQWQCTVATHAVTKCMYCA